MSSVGYGIPWPVDGPPPVPRKYGLLQAADIAGSGVRVVPDQDDRGVERWINGVEVWPLPVDPAGTFDPCAASTMPEEKAVGTVPARPLFGTLTVYVPVTCSAVGIADQAEFRARAAAALAAVEGAAVERELLAGERMLNNPHLADGEGTFPNADTATDPVNGVALLEAEIAATGKGGLIHVPPQVSAALSARGALRDDGGLLRTIGNGTAVIPGAGYAEGADPSGHAAATGTQDWIYATGGIDVRRSEVFTIPETLGEALDRALNDVTYRAERYYLVTWDAVLQAAVLVDRCDTTC